jgi:hypothetical protein
MTLVRLELSGRSVTAAVRTKHRDGTLTVEPCSGEWMGKRMRLPETAISRLEAPAVDRAILRDAERQAR